jgi:hypothetical protein
MAVIQPSDLADFWNLFQETFYCGCQAHVLAAPYVCYVAFLEEGDPRVVECTKCGATWLASDCPVFNPFELPSYGEAARK